MSVDRGTLPLPLPDAPAPKLNVAALLAWGAVGIIALLIAYPTAMTLLSLVQSGAGGAAAVARAANSGPLWPVIGNTAIVVVGGTLLALVGGTLLAWLNERTDGAVRGAGELLPLIPLLVPPIAGVMGWATLLDPNVGFVNVLIREGLALAGIELTQGPIDLYSLGGLVGMTALYLLPYVYLVVSAALRQLDPGLEEASRISGANPWKTLVRITVPAIAPAIVSAAVLTVIGGLGMFAVPIVIGTAARIDVLSTYIFRLLDTYPPQTALALLLAAGMVAAVQGLILVQGALVRRGRHATIGGRGMKASSVSLGWLRHVARALAGFYLVAASVLPMAGLLIVSLQPFWTPLIDIGNLSLANFRFVLFENGPTVRALVTSLSLAVAVATAVMLVVGFIVVRSQFSKGRLGLVSDVLTSLPASVPHTVVGVGFLLAFSQAPVRLYGTVFILLLAYFVMALPYAGRAARAAASSIGAELGEASRVFGAGEGRTFLRILLPLAFPGLAAGWAIIFIHTAGEVTASSLLAGTRNPVVGRLLMELWVYGSFPQVAALSLVMALVNTIFVILILRLGRRHGGVALA